MDQVRGIVMIGLGIFVLYRGWVMPPGQKAWFAWLLGVLAIALGAWRIRRKPPRPLV